MIHMVWWLQLLWLDALNTHEKHQSVDRSHRPAGLTGDLHNNSHTLSLTSISSDSEETRSCPFTPITEMQLIFFHVRFKTRTFKNVNDLTLQLQTFVLGNVSRGMYVSIWRFNLILWSETVPSVGQNYRCTLDKVEYVWHFNKNKPQLFHYIFFIGLF